MNMLNNKMEKLAKEMVMQLDNLAVEDIELNTIMVEQREKMNKYISKIEKIENNLTSIIKII